MTVAYLLDALASFVSLPVGDTAGIGDDAQHLPALEVLRFNNISSQQEVGTCCCFINPSDSF